MAVTAKQMLSAVGVGRIPHGADAAAARPTGFATVIWIGSVQPKNAIDNDLWVDTK